METASGGRFFLVTDWPQAYPVTDEDRAYACQTPQLCEMVPGVPDGAPSWHAGIALKAAAWRRGSHVTEAPGAERRVLDFGHFAVGN